MTHVSSPKYVSRARSEMIQIWNTGGLLEGQSSTTCYQHLRQTVNGTRMHSSPIIQRVHTPSRYISQHPQEPLIKSLQIGYYDSTPAYSTLHLLAKSIRSETRQLISVCTKLVRSPGRIEPGRVLRRSFGNRSHSVISRWALRTSQTSWLSKACNVTSIWA